MHVFWCRLLGNGSCPQHPNDPEWIMEKGYDLPVFDLDFARVGILTCYDGWFPATIDLNRLRHIRKHSRNCQQRRPELYGEILKKQTAWGQTIADTN